MKNNLDQYKKELIQVIYKIAQDEKLLFDFMRDILTPKDFETLAVRWQIVKRLEKGEHHQDIAKSLGVGVATVTRGSREIQKENGGFQRVFKVIRK